MEAFFFYIYYYLPDLGFTKRFWRKSKFYKRVTVLEKCDKKLN
jgi:hypothetical protein